jgi:hypothetical protein
VGRMSDSGWVFVQRMLVVHTKVFDEGEFAERKAWWRSSQTFRPRQNVCTVEQFILLVRYESRGEKVCE